MDIYLKRRRAEAKVAHEWSKVALIIGGFMMLIATMITTKIM